MNRVYNFTRHESTVSSVSCNSLSTSSVFLSFPTFSSSLKNVYSIERSEEERVSSCSVEFLTREKFAIRVAISLLIPFPFETKNLLSSSFLFQQKTRRARFRFLNEFSFDSNSKIESRYWWSRDTTVTIGILRRTVEQRISEDRPIYHPDKEITMGFFSRVRYRAASKPRKLGGDEARQ